MPIHFDKTLTASMDARKRLAIAKKFEKLKGKTYFNDYELKCMLLLYEKLSPKRAMKKSVFSQALRVIAGITEDDILDRLYCALETPSKNGVMYDQWVSLMSLYCRGNFEDKMVFTFKNLDIMDTGFIARTILEDRVKNQLSKDYGNASEQEIKAYIRMVFELLDSDGDGQVSWNDFRKIVTEYPSMINCLGRVIPEQNVMDVFLTTFTQRVGPKYTTMYRKTEMKNIAFEA